MLLSLAAAAAAAKAEGGFSPPLETPEMVVGFSLLLPPPKKKRGRKRWKHACFPYVRFLRGKKERQEAAAETRSVWHYIGAPFATSESGLCSLFLFKSSTTKHSWVRVLKGRERKNFLFFTLRRRRRGTIPERVPSIKMARALRARKSLF